MRVVYEMFSGTVATAGSNIIPTDEVTGLVIYNDSVLHSEFHIIK